MLCQPWARIVIVSGQELGPTHASLRSAIAIMITTSNSSSIIKRSRTPHQLPDVRPEHHRLFRAVLRTNRTCSTADNPIPGASSNTAGSLVSAPSPPRSRHCHGINYTHPRHHAPARRFVENSTTCLSINQQRCVVSSSLSLIPSSKNWGYTLREKFGYTPSPVLPDPAWKRDEWPLLATAQQDNVAF